jgi:hypothetical protein
LLFQAALDWLQEFCKLGFPRHGLDPSKAFESVSRAHELLEMPCGLLLNWEFVAQASCLLEGNKSRSSGVLDEQPKKSSSGNNNRIREFEVMRYGLKGVNAAAFAKKMRQKLEHAGFEVKRADG